MWTLIIKLVLLVILAFLLRPEKPKPPEAGTLKAPKTNQTSNIPVIFGTVWIADATVTWFGDLSTDPIHADDLDKGGGGKS